MSKGKRSLIMAGRIRSVAAGQRPCRLSIAAPGRFSLRETVLSHGWHQLCPFRWDDAGSVLWRCESFPDGAPRLLRISQKLRTGSALQVHILDPQAQQLLSQGDELARGMVVAAAPLRFCVVQ